MVPGSRNPLWGEEFNFSVEELPVQVVIRPFTTTSTTSTWFLL